MPCGPLVPLLVMALTAAPPPDLRDAALGSAGAGAAAEVLEVASAGLPPPPELAVIQTQTFGTITLDHRAHLARKTSCRTCHGPGPVGKLGRLPARVAHDRCVTCHRVAENAPTACRDCHVKAAPAPEPEVVTAALGDGSAGGAAGAAAPVHLEGAPAGGTVVPASLLAELQAMRTRELEERVRNPFRRVLGVGFSATGGPGRDVTTGPALSITAREGRVLLLYAIERGTFSGESRTLGLVGAGLTHAVRGPWNVHAIALGGFDVIENPTTFSPTVGLRGGIEWLGRRTSVSLDATAAEDLVSGVNKLGQQTGGFTWSVGASVGFVVARD
jgi:hypothetical protein